AQLGQWNGPFTWPVVGVHMTLLQTGKVLIFDGQTFGHDKRVWDPTTGTFTSVPSADNDNVFCSGHSTLRDGRVLVAGGNDQNASHLGIADANIFNPATQSWAAGSLMATTRWYPTNTTLPDGRVLVTSGEIGCDTVPPDGTFHPECLALIPEIYNATT